jgi:hypothetical protein
MHQGTKAFRVLFCLYPMYFSLKGFSRPFLSPTNQSFGYPNQKLVDILVSDEPTIQSEAVIREFDFFLAFIFGGHGR